ncbi:short-chain fatty acid transporter [Desmospora activa]|uniref:Short-chain fatty acids transporter n=1 Tax=Desmospora activa DSM 45169 TaxID=1121389 RepID=A0A2T4Z8D7_9BACL|nr:short-chain fatty acid transporter [Desmospora activa]PTM58163.1 short-chain fatty acids transporter [Desmospora activa DSM 45169]
MLKGMTRFFDRLVQRYLPDPFLFATLLTLVVYGMGIVLTDSGPVQMMRHWGEGFWGLLEFAMQMVLVLVTGYVLASSRAFQTGLAAMARLARTPPQAILLVTVVSAVASWINWGFGLVIGALFARQIARVVADVDYRLLIASAYSGFLLWHGGLAGSVPLTIATEGHFAAEQIGIVPTSETIFSGFNLFISISLLIVLPLLNRLMMNTYDHPYRIDAKLLQDESAVAKEESETGQTPADRLENSRLISLAIGGLGMWFIVTTLIENRFELNLNLVNLLFLSLGILFHQTPRHFLNSVREAVKNAGGIIIQFPLYAGIMGMMVSSGLAEQMSLWFVSISNAFTYPLFAFISAGIVNFFVPSGGGQWAVQAPVMLPAGLELGVDAAKTAMAVAWGDAWTNMIQPFWALPALAIAGLRARDIMGFCIVTLFVSGIIIACGLLLL